MIVDPALLLVKIFAVGVVVGILTVLAFQFF